MPGFYPSKAMVRDFDNDSNNFKAFSRSEVASGKWLTMGIADYDNDSYSDIFLGSYFHTFGEYFKQVSKKSIKTLSTQI